MTARVLYRLPKVISEMVGQTCRFAATTRRSSPTISEISFGNHTSGTGVPQRPARVFQKSKTSRARTPVPLSAPLSSLFLQASQDFAGKIRQRPEDFLDHSRRHFLRHRGFDVRARMHQVNRPRATAAFHSGRKIGDAILLDENKHVLRVPPGHFLVAPDLCPDAVQNLKAAFSKESNPVGGPLFVDVMRAALAGHGGGKHGDI